MNTFTWLVMGHLVGDWLLQNDWMAHGKKQGWFTQAGLTHFAIYTASVMGALWLSGFQSQPLEAYLLVFALIFVSHWLIDASDVVERWMRFYRQTHNLMVSVMVDQTLHLLVLLGVALLTPNA